MPNERIMRWYYPQSQNVDISSTEQKNYYNKYIRKLRLEIDDEGVMRKYSKS